MKPLVRHHDRVLAPDTFAERIGLSRPGCIRSRRPAAPVLGADLDRPRTRLSLHLAVLALRLEPEGPINPSRR